MSDHQVPADQEDVDTSGPTFVWHPTYAGKSYAEVLSALTDEIRRDQKSYELAMDGAEAAEGDALTTVVDLERRWSVYDFDWAEMDSATLASRILAYNVACEERQEMIPFSEYRASGALTATPTIAASSPESSLPIMKIGAAILVVLIVIFLLAILL